MARITITLTTDVRDALWLIAERELRHPRDQAAMLLRLELARRGLLPTLAPDLAPTPQAAQPAEVHP